MWNIVMTYNSTDYPLIDTTSNTQQLDDPVLTETIGKAGELSFVMPSDHPAAGYVHPFLSYLTVTRDSDTYWKGRIIRVEKTYYGDLSVTAEGELAYLNDTVTKPYNFTGTVLQYITQLLGYHNSQVGSDKQIQPGQIFWDTTVSDPLPSSITLENSGYTKTLSELTSKVATAYGGYFEIVYRNGQRQLDLWNVKDTQNTQVLTIETNIMDFDETAGGISDFYTRIIPSGKDGLVLTSPEYVENTALVQKYGIITTHISYDDIETAALLRSTAQKQVDAMDEPRTIVVKAIDLHDFDDTIAALLPGRLTTINSPFHGESGTQYVLISKVSDFYNPENSSVTFGRTESTFTRQIRKKEEEIEDEEDYEFDYDAATRSSFSSGTTGKINFDFDSSLLPSAFSLSDGTTGLTFDIDGLSLVQGSTKTKLIGLDGTSKWDGGSGSGSPLDQYYNTSTKIFKDNDGNVSWNMNDGTFTAGEVTIGTSSSSTTRVLEVLGRMSVSNRLTADTIYAGNSKVRITSDGITGIASGSSTVCGKIGFFKDTLHSDAKTMILGDESGTYTTMITGKIQSGRTRAEAQAGITTVSSSDVVLPFTFTDGDGNQVYMTFINGICVALGK